MTIPEPNKVPPTIAVADKSVKVKLSPLVQFILRGLDHCWLEKDSKWSYIYHLDGRLNPNVSFPQSDVPYSLNVLLGFSRLLKSGYVPNFDPKQVFDRNISALVELPVVAAGAYGMALWSSAELGFDLPSQAMRHIRAFIEDRDNWQGFRAQDLGQILTGVVAKARHEPADWSVLAHELFSFLVGRFSCSSGLFFDGAHGLRRRWASFASQTYLTLACYHFGEFSGDKNALQLANACSQRLIQLQGPKGEWPWFFDVPSGAVVDYYEVYSVHQDGMAPAFLEHAERHNVPGATDALKKGFAWIYGNNELGRSMLVPDKGLFIRSQVRNGELNSKNKRVARAILNTFLRRSDSPSSASKLTLRLECRSYHLGWAMWSFAARDDVSEITHHPDLQWIYGRDRASA